MTTFLLCRESSAAAVAIFQCAFWHAVNKKEEEADEKHTLVPDERVIIDKRCIIRFIRERLFK